MDFSKCAQDVRDLARREGLLRDGQTLQEQERVIRQVSLELGRVALQQEIDAKPQRGYQGSSRLCVCGLDQKFCGYRARGLQTLLGPVKFTRAYYHCRGCHRGDYPEDARQGLGVHHLTEPLARAVSELGEAMPYRQVAQKLDTLAGVKLSASTCQRVTDQVGAVAQRLEEQAARQVREHRHAAPARVAGRLYTLADGVMVHQTHGWHESKCLQCRWQDAKGNWRAEHLCRMEPAEDFAPLAHACMHRCGLDNARETVLSGDGAAWIWNHLGPIADEALQVLDWYHASAHLWAAAKAVHGEGTPACAALARQWEGLLWASEHERLRGQILALRGRVRSPAKRKALADVAGYIVSQRGRMDYKRYREMGLEIGSGAIEGDCKNLVHARMKRGSPRWSPSGCQHMLSLRCCYANHAVESLWRHHPLRPAA